MNWKTPITLAVLLVLLLGSVYFGWQAVTAPATSDTSTSTPTTSQQTGCTKKTHLSKGQGIQSKDITVNVYNAGGISGLAAATSSKLAANGFLVGQVTDAPARVSVFNVAILDKATRSPEVKLVASQFKGPVVIRKDDLAPGIDVVVGDAFQAVDPQAKSSLVVRRKVRTCS